MKALTIVLLLSLAFSYNLKDKRPPLEKHNEKPPEPPKNEDPEEEFEKIKLSQLVKDEIQKK